MRRLYESEKDLNIYELKDVFSGKDFKKRRVWPYDGARVLKTKEGLISMLIYVLTSSFTIEVLAYYIFRINVNGGITTNLTVWAYMLVGLFLYPIGMAFAYTAPLKDSMSRVAKMYSHYFGYYLSISIFIIAFLEYILYMFYSGNIKVAIISIVVFYVLYRSLIFRVFLAPGIIALTDKSFTSAMKESIRLTRRWRGLGFFLMYLIVLEVVHRITSYSLHMLSNGNVLAIPVILVSNIPLFVIASSITLYVFSRR